MFNLILNLGSENFQFNRAYGIKVDITIGVTVTL
jgi:hypothetical protein